ncbi:MAG: rubrerythrin family protein [Candidatus Altiarchaeota archaeon]|nr:rubrerythrin family protein [Candidatus Altiarchaeota archaeon]
MDVQKLLLDSQKNEITEYHVYNELAKFADAKNAKVLRQIAKEELKHYEWFKKKTGRDVKPSRTKIFKFKMAARIFGFTFAAKLMEYGEMNAQEVYGKIAKVHPDIKPVIKDEVKHERQLIDLIAEDRLKYLGSMVLGLNDALVELTGVLAGLTFALQNSLLVGIAGLITGISATLSMMASEYLSQRAEKAENPAKASIYTGIAYAFAVAVLIIPYFVFKSSVFTALAVSLFGVLIVIATFTYFVSIVDDKNFIQEFLTMAGISYGVALISFFVGMIARTFLGLEV